MIIRKNKLPIHHAVITGMSVISEEIGNEYDYLYHLLRFGSGSLRGGIKNAMPCGESFQRVGQNLGVYLA